MAAAAAPAAVPLLPALDDYQHARWGTDEGAPPAVRSMAQTADGWLWLGTLDGLYRFDGNQFARYPLPPDGGLNRDLIVSLHPGARGELYIVHVAEGASVLTPDGRVARLPALPGPVRGIDSLAVDADGSVWVVSQGIYQLRGGSWHMVEDASRWSARDLRSFMLDRNGALWLTRADSTWRLDRASGRFAQVAAFGGELLTAPDGGLWLLHDSGALRTLGPAATASTGAPAPAPLPRALEGAQFAPDGSLWALACPEQPCFVPAPAADLDLRSAPRIAIADAVGAPAGGRAQLVLADREGNIWISSENGLDRFRRKRFSATGLSGPGTDYALAADAGGRVWAAHRASGALWRLLPDGARPAPARHPVSVLSTTPAGELLLGGRRSIWRLDEAIPELPLPPGPPGSPADKRMLGILDDGVMLWTATFETGLIGWRDGRWHRPAGLGLPEKIYQSARAGVGSMWLATGDGELYLYDTARRRSAAPVDIRALGMVAAIFPGSELVVSGARGSGVVRGGKLSMLRSADPNALRNVSGLVVGAGGDRWLNGAAGLVRIAAADWRRSIADPAQPLRTEIFGSSDGYPGRAVIERRWPSAWSADGRHLWLVATGGVVRFDTALLARNRVAPTPVILAVGTDHDGLRPPTRGAPLRLAPGTGRFRIEYTAPALRSPERVRFEYLLEGVDSAWQDAGARRSTSYTRIAPGDYVFRLRALNEDGVPSAADATLAITVLPTVWQTAWFKLLAAALAGLLLAGAYRYRVRYLTRRLAERIALKTAERERIARTLHDSFLQTVQSLLLRVDAVASSLPESAAARRQLEGILAHAGRALGEGREQLHELRTDSGDRLELMLEDALAQLQLVHPGVNLGLRNEGAPRRLRADAAGEAVAIAREALHNACRHGGADQVRASLAYSAEALTLELADNGRGFGAATLRGDAAPGHWGLVGMRERAGRIGARLDLANGAEGGAIVRLTIPAARAYAGDAAPAG